VSAITVLEELDRAVRDAGLLTDRIRTLCAQGQPFDAVIDELSGCVNRIEAVVAEGGVEFRSRTAPKLAELAKVLFGATATIEANKQTLTLAIESIAQRERVRRTYARPVG
jgi:hypothetical protein